MSTATLTTINPILKEVYGPQIVNQIQDEVITLKRIESTSEGFGEDVQGGKYVSFPVRLSRNSGIGSRLENEQTPTAGFQSYGASQIPLKYDYGALKVTGQIIKMAVTNPQAFANAFDREVTGLKDDLVKNTNRVVYGDGTGLLASFSSADGVNTFIVDNTQYINEGDRVDILTSATGAAKAVDRIITSIAPIAGGTTATVTYDGTDVTVAAGDGIYRNGNFTGGIIREPNGFARIVNNTGALQNLNPATAGQSRWASSVLGNSGTPRALSESLMIQMVDTVYTASGKRPTAIFTSLGVRRSYFNLLTQQRRFTGTTTFAGGMKGLTFTSDEDIPVVSDPDCPYRSMFMINEPSFAIVKNTDWEFADEQGDILTKVQGYDVFEGLMRKFWELATRQRNANGRINDIIEG